MRRKLLLLIAVITLTINASAQYKDFQFGLMGQVGYSWMSVSNDSISNVKNGFSGKYGLFGTYLATENYGISSGIYFKSHRAKYDFKYRTTDINTMFNHSFTASYIEVPVLFKCQTDLIAEKFRILGEFGVGLDFLVNHKDTYTSLDGNNVAINPTYRKFTSSVIIALGAEMKVFKSSGIIAQIVFDKSFISMFKPNSYYTPMRMTSLYFEVGFFF